MKKIYTEAELEVILFDKNDIIVTSGGPSFSGGYSDSETVGDTTDLWG